MSTRTLGEMSCEGGTHLNEGCGLHDSKPLALLVRSFLTDGHSEEAAVCQDSRRMHSDHSEIMSCSHVAALLLTSNADLTHGLVVETPAIANDQDIKIP